MHPDYENAGDVIGAWVGVIVFIGCWIYCIATYGFLMGVGLGWLPSAICAAIAGAIAKVAWPLVLLALAWVLWTLFGPH